MVTLSRTLIRLSLKLEDVKNRFVVHLPAMRTAQVSELKERIDDVIEAVKNGETVEIREGDDAVAEFVPRGNGAVRSKPTPSDRTPASPDQTALEAHMDKLVRE